MANAIQYIMTDLDGVLRHFPRGRDLEIETAFGLPADVISNTAFELGLLEQVIKGKMTDDEWRWRIGSHLQARFPNADCKSVIKAWSDFPGQIDHEVLEYLESLAVGRKLILLTNATSRLLEDLEKVGLHDRFDQIFNSSSIGHIKPSKEIFQHILAELRCDSSEIIFIDDSKSNVLAGESLGIKGFHFRSLETFKAELAQVADITWIESD